MASATTLKSTRHRKIGECRAVGLWDFNANLKKSALGAQTLLDAVVGYDQFKANQ